MAIDSLVSNHLSASYHPADYSAFLFGPKCPRPIFPPCPFLVDVDRTVSFFEVLFPLTGTGLSEDFPDDDPLVV